MHTVMIRLDTVRISMDIVRIRMDTVMIRMDTVRICMGIVRIWMDTVMIRMDRVRVSMASQPHPRNLSTEEGLLYLTGWMRMNHCHIGAYSCLAFNCLCVLPGGVFLGHPI